MPDRRKSEPLCLHHYRGSTINCTVHATKLLILKFLTLYLLHASPTAIDFDLSFYLSGIQSYLQICFFRSLDRLILNFPRLIIKLKPRLNCKIAEIVMKRSFILAQRVKLWRNETGTNRIVWGGGEYLVEKLMKYYD